MVVLQQVFWLGPNQNACSAGYMLQLGPELILQLHIQLTDMGGLGASRDIYELASNKSRGLASSEIEGLAFCKDTRTSQKFYQF